MMGDIVGKPEEEAEVRVSVEDADPLDKVAKFELFEDGKVVESHLWDQTAGFSNDWNQSRPDPRLSEVDLGEGRILVPCFD
jgi:hypothetical protein